MRPLRLTPRRVVTGWVARTGPVLSVVAIDVMVVALVWARAPAIERVADMGWSVGLVALIAVPGGAMHMCRYRRDRRRN